MKITDFVKADRDVEFHYYRKGYFYYLVANVNEINGIYLFPIPADDLGDATLNRFEKSTFMMRYIRKAIEEGTMVKLTR